MTFLLRRFAVLAALTLLAAVLLGWSPAFANTATGGADCTQAFLHAENYNADAENTYSLTLDQTTKSGTFGAGVDVSIPTPQDDQTHLWSYDVQGQDGSDHFSDSGTVGPCAPPCPEKCPVPRQGEGKDLACDGIYKGGTYEDVHVKRGDSCTLIGAYVNGSVKAFGAHDVKVLDTTVVKSIHVENATGTVKVGNRKGCKYDPVVGSSIIVLDSHHVLICEVTVCHDIVVKGNDGRITVIRSSARQVVVAGNLAYVGPAPTAHRRPDIIRIYDSHATNGFVIRHNHRQVNTRNLTTG